MNRVSEAIREARIRREDREEEEEGELVAMVKVLEPLGREVLLRVGLDGVDVQMKVSDRISIQFDLDRLFVFDPTTGNTVYPVG
ncbi:MAG TPA: hypothetical protein DCY88_11665 [Cyanobacteria bacterium UBA11372]|nr:hypothetical protein [Cyanobacteria bacterium UBA11372]HBE51979.1 hypothetical protein [Cyanobacteria bacterium UBA11369]